jgi:hypothetical protein
VRLAERAWIVHFVQNNSTASSCLPRIRDDRTICCPRMHEVKYGSFGNEIAHVIEGRLGRGIFHAYERGFLK